MQVPLRRVECRPHPQAAKLIPPAVRVLLPREPWAQHKLAVWMGSTWGAVPTPSADHQAHPELHEHELERAKKRMNCVLGENLESLHRECQRSAPQSAQKCVPGKHAALLNPVQGKILKTGSSPSTTRNWNVDVLLRNPLQRRTRYDRRHFHQLFCQLRVSGKDVRTGTSSGRILGTSITCSRTVKSLSKNRSTSGSCSTNCGTGASRICTMGEQQTKSTMCSMVCRWTRSCGRGSPRTPGRTRGVFVKQLEEHRIPGCFGLVSP